MQSGFKTTMYFTISLQLEIQCISVLEQEKAMATHSRTLAWEIPWTEEPGRLQSMGSLRVGQDWVTSLSIFTFMQWRRKWQPTPVFFPGESWRILEMGEPGGLPSMGSHRVRHDWCDLVAAGTNYLSELNKGSFAYSQAEGQGPLRQAIKYDYNQVPCDSAGKESPAMWETWVWSLGWEDPLEKGKATHSSILAWRMFFPGLPW